MKDAEIRKKDDEIYKRNTQLLRKDIQIQHQTTEIEALKAKLTMHPDSALQKVTLLSRQVTL